MAVAAGAAGCNKPRITVAGRVVSGGMPVAHATIRFTPDLDKGNDGPSVALRADDSGAFTSDRDRLVITAGENLVVVTVPVTGPQGDVGYRDHKFRTDIPAGGIINLIYDIPAKTPREK
jgi:hypothetical protein